MRVAAIYDIHGNLPALEAVLEEVERAAVDRIVVGGDVVPGPMPSETLSRLLNLELPVQFVRGNGELAVLDHAAGRQGRALPPEAQQAIEWTAEQLCRENGLVFEGWPSTLRLIIDGIGAVLFCHATPRDENECFTRLTCEAGLLRAMRNGPHLARSFSRSLRTST